MYKDCGVLQWSQHPIELQAAVEEVFCVRMVSLDLQHDPTIHPACPSLNARQVQRLLRATPSCCRVQLDGSEIERRSRHEISKVAHPFWVGGGTVRADPDAHPLDQSG